MQNVALLYYTIKKIQRFEDRVIWRVYHAQLRAITPFFPPGMENRKSHGNGMHGLLEGHLCSTLPTHLLPDTVECREP